MREVTPGSAADYLRQTGRVPEGKAVDVRALGWGVSNVVLRVEVEGEEPFVLKQSRERLRTRAHWVSRLERIWAEQAALELLDTVLPAGTVPRVLFADPDNYLFAMSCAPEDSAVWKEQLLAGTVDEAVARRAGEVLGAMHAATFGHPALASGPLADTTVFDELRIDPFYRTVAQVHPEAAATVNELAEAAGALAPGERCFVHADFSPKNILVHRGGLTVVDFETAHAGDPTFDLGFFLSHLLLKAVRAAPHGGAILDLARAFLDAYRRRLGVEPAGGRAVAHAALCGLARVDGKSPVDYLDEPARGLARRLALTALRDRPADLEGLLGIAARDVHLG